MPIPRKPPIDSTELWLLPVGAHHEVVNRTDGFVGIVDDVAADDLGRAIAGRQFLHIDFDEFDRLRRALRSGPAGISATLIIAAPAKIIALS